VQKENIGLAKLADSTRLIRIGAALPGEIAVWRYGRTLVRRRRRHIAAVGGAAALSLAWGGLSLVGVLGGLGGLAGVWALAWQFRESQKLIHRLPADASPTGAPFPLRRYQLNGVRLTTDAEGRPALYLPRALDPVQERNRGGAIVWTERPVVLEGEVARSVLARAMVAVNGAGATSSRVSDALALLDAAGGTERFLGQAAAKSAYLGVPTVLEFHRNYGPTGRRIFTGSLLRAEAAPHPLPAHPERGDRLGPLDALAVEMALHEEAERRALEGELEALRAAWEEAEAIARIADSL